MDLNIYFIIFTLLFYYKYYFCALYDGKQGELCSVRTFRHYVVDLCYTAIYQPYCDRQVWYYTTYGYEVVCYDYCVDRAFKESNFIFKELPNTYDFKNCFNSRYSAIKLAFNELCKINDQHFKCERVLYFNRYSIFVEFDKIDEQIISCYWNYTHYIKFYKVKQRQKYEFIVHSKSKEINYVNASVEQILDDYIYKFINFIFSNIYLIALLLIFIRILNIKLIYIIIKFSLFWVVSLKVLFAISKIISTLYL
jgi:hypothetical protein